MTARSKHATVLSAALKELAALYGVTTAYTDSDGRRRVASADTILHVLRVLGANIDRPEQAGAAAERRRLELWRRTLEPVTVCWDGHWPELLFRTRVPAASFPGTTLGQFGSGQVALELVLEDGTERSWRVPADLISQVDRADLGGERYGLFKVAVGDAAPGLRGLRGDERLPPGYHSLRLSIPDAGIAAETLVVSAPAKALSPPHARPRGERTSAAWGVFAPTYGLRSERNWGVGDLGDLETLRNWAEKQGAEVLATLPLFAAYLSQPFEPAPYRPVSRLFWNELFLAVDHVPELAWCPPALDATTAGAFDERLKELRQLALVDYEAAMALKRSVLELLAGCFFSDGSPERTAGFAAFMHEHQEAEQYARFRATAERFGSDWRSWPRSVSASPLRPDLFAPSVRDYHLYCQWQMAEQLERLTAAEASTRDGAAGGRDETACPPLFSSRARLCLDLPLGVHPGGFDTWRWPWLFAEDVSAGAPPDTFFTRGQDWALRPLHPERIRDDGYRYLSACLRTLMRYGSYIRLDHVMSLHRLYWIPERVGATDGVYVEYPAEEMYAVVALESVRNGAAVIGEDLGTVPPPVRPAMRRHGLLRSWVLQLSLRPPEPEDADAEACGAPFDPPPPGSFASINTHDTFPFAGFLAGGDIQTRVETGQLPSERSRHEQKARAALVRHLAAYFEVSDPETSTGRQELLRKILNALGQSEAGVILVNLEDLWDETAPQNLPGTGDERPNWRRKLALTVEELGQLDLLVPNA